METGYYVKCVGLTPIAIVQNKKSYFYKANSKLDLEVNLQFSDEVAYEDLAEEEKGKKEIYAIDGNGNPYSPSWYTLNLKSMYKLNENFTLTAGLENITDQRYRPYSSGIVAPGKNFILALRAKF